MRRDMSSALAMAAVLCGTAAPAFAQSPAGNAASPSVISLLAAGFVVLLVGVRPLLRHQPVPVPVRRRRR